MENQLRTLSILCPWKHPSIKKKKKKTIDSSSLDEYWRAHLAVIIHPVCNGLKNDYINCVYWNRFWCSRPPWYCWVLPFIVTWYIQITCCKSLLDFFFSSVASWLSENITSGIDASGCDQVNLTDLFRLVSIRLLRRWNESCTKREIYARRGWYCAV